jgi:hypothetical protein
MTTTLGFYRKCNIFGTPVIAFRVLNEYQTCTMLSDYNRLALMGHPVLRLHVPRQTQTVYWLTA